MSFLRKGILRVSLIIPLVFVKTHISNGMLC